MGSENLSCVIMGRFKHKEAIDSAIEELSALGVTILAPDKGRLYESKWEGFCPLMSEIGKSPGVVEDEFLRNIIKATFVYLVNPDGYIGNTVSLEVGFCLGLGKRIYAQRKLDPLKLENDLVWVEVNQVIDTLPFKEIVEKELEIARCTEGPRLLRVER